ncbi:mitochondrial basic amino acids transporter [Culicoides brevitarsis]|uniref:mitochondrial basic amino acids transporter n=1 Tax=Culicoides brevitarsis TaxID=469753 RepID=UPI00307B2863
MALDFVAGCIGGCAGVLVGHPFDTVKVHLQTQDPRNPRYRGTFDCLRTIVAKESLRGLYKGIGSPIAGVAFVNGIVFGVYGNVQKNYTNPDSLNAHFMAGCAAGVAQSVVCSPMELVKTRLQLQDNIKGIEKTKGPIDCMMHIWKNKGTRGIFKGLGITAARDLPGFSSYFVAYELMVQEKHASSAHILMAGGLAGVFSWLVSFPIDVIKTRMQVDGFNATTQYKSYWDCLQKSYKSEGWRLFTRGLGSTLIRAFPMNAVCFLVVTWIMKLNVNMNTAVEVEARHHVPNHKEELKMTAGRPSKILRLKRDDDLDYISRIKSNTIRGLTLMGAFHEDSIHNAEIVEMAHHWDTGSFYDTENVLDFGKILAEKKDHDRKFEDAIVLLSD